MMMRSTMDPEASAEFVRLMGGLDFRSFEDFLSKFSEYQRQTASCFVVRDSITIKRYNEKHPDTPLDEGLRYTYIRYGCVHGKPKRDSRYAESHQRKHANFDCPARFGLKHKEGGLVLFDIGVGHNHDFQVGSPWMYSKNRRLTDEQQGEMLQMLVTCKSSQALRDQVEAMYNIRMNRFDCSNVRRRTMRTNPDLFRQQMKEEPDNDEDDSKRTVSFPPPERTRKRRKLEDPT